MKEMGFTEDIINNRNTFSDQTKNFKNFQEKERNTRNNIWTKNVNKREIKRVKSYWKIRNGLQQN